MPQDDQAFVQQLLQIGIVSYKEQETLLDIAKRCAKTYGIATAGAGAVWGAQGGTVALPGIGTISGAAAGALAGMIGGTFACTTANMAVRNELKKLARGE